MCKRLKIFYVFDLMFIVLSFIGMIILNNKEEYGLSALTNVGKFTALLTVFVVSIVLNLVITFICLIFNLKNKKEKHIEK